MFIVIGAGGHAKVVLDALLARGVARSEILVCDGELPSKATDILGFPIAPFDLPDAGVSFHLAIGQNAARARLGEGPALLLTIIHPAAAIAAGVQIDDGCFVAAHAIIAADAKLGRGAIINHGAVVDHDCVIGDFAHVAPNATLGGGVEIGSKCLIGAGATVLPGVRVGRDCIVGAGAVVLHNIGDGETWVGNPAHKLG